MLVLACALPTVVGFATLSIDAYTRQKAHLTDNAQHLARALLLAVERDLSNSETAARALAGSPSLRDGDLPDFRRQATALVTPDSPVVAFVLREAGGKELLRTHPAPARVVAVDVPVRADGERQYVLSAELRAERFNELLFEQEIPAGWTAQVFDSSARFVARNRNAARVIGLPANPLLLQAMAQADSGVLAMHSRENVPVMAAFRRSAQRGWFVSVGVPRDAARGALDATLQSVLLAIGALLAIGLATSWLIGGAISRSVRALTGPAAALGRGEALVLEDLRISETAEVGAALRQVEGELQRYRGNLERLVRERTAELERSNALLATVYATAPVGLILLDCDLRITMINDYLAAINRMPSQAHLGRTLPELFGEPGVRYEEPFRQVRDSGRPLPAVEVTLPEPLDPSREGHLIVGYHPVFGGDRRLMGISAVILDISPRIAAEQALRASELRLQSVNERLVQALECAQKASSAKSEFLANMSHEIRTPMNAIMGLARLLQEAPLGRREREYVGKMTMATRSLLGILNDVLDLTKIEAGQMELEHTAFTLEQVLGSVSVLVEPAAAAKGVELVFDVMPAVPATLYGDPMRLEQVLLNLIGNAVKFTERGEVVLTVRVDDAMLAFSVRDTGIGIRPEQRHRLFEAFSQGDSSTSRTFGGAGLGLAICRRLVGLMGGAISVRSEPGQGAEFAFTARFGADGPAAPQRSGHSAGRALLVDDNASARAALARQCALHGYEVDSAGAPADALRLLGERRYDLLLLDSAMPDMDGITLLTDARTRLAGPLPPCVMLAAESARAPLDDMAGDLQLGAVLGKPVTPGSLATALARLRTGPAEQAAAPASPLAGRLQGLRVLLVEDNQINQEVAHYLLAHAGAAVDIAGNGRIAVDRLRAQPQRYDAVLMDVQMPVMNGYEAAAEIRRMGLSTLPIIAMTANVMADDRAHAISAGMDGHVSKPIDVDSLVAALRRVTGRGETDAPARTVPTLAAAVAGIDLGPTLRRFDGDYGRFVSLFKRFEATQGATLAEVRTLVDAGQRGEAAARLHRLRGVAANLGAAQVAAASLELEQDLRAGTDAALPERLARLEQALAQVFDAARALAPPAEADAPGMERAGIQAALAHLLGLLQNNNLKAISVFDGMRPALANLPDKLLEGAEYAALAEAVATLAFAPAAARVEALLARLDATTGLEPT